MERLVAVRLQSHPSGATVVNASNVKVGVTPHDLIVPASSGQHVKFIRSGYKPVERDFRADQDTTIAVVLEVDGPPPPTTVSARRIHKRREEPGQPAVPPPMRTAKRVTHRNLDSRATTIDPFSR